MFEDNLDRGVAPPIATARAIAFRVERVSDVHEQQNCLLQRKYSGDDCCLIGVDFEGIIHPLTIPIGQWPAAATVPLSPTFSCGHQSRLGDFGVVVGSERKLPIRVMSNEIPDPQSHEAEESPLSEYTQQ